MPKDKLTLEDIYFLVEEADPERGNCTHWDNRLAAYTDGIDPYACICCSARRTLGALVNVVNKLNGVPE